MSKDTNIIDYKTNETQESEENIVESRNCIENNIMHQKIRRNLISSAFYEFLIAAIFIGLPYVIIEVLRLDMLVPLFTIRNAWIWFTIGGIMIFMILLQVIYGLFIQKLDHTKGGKIFGNIIGLFMCVIFPTGTFFGLILIQYLHEPKEESEKSVETKKITKSDIQNSLGKFIIITGILMLHMPVILLLLNKFLIGLPLDMAYPIIKSEIYDDWDLMMWIFFAIFSIQVIIGILYMKIGDKKWIKISVIPFAIFQIISFGIALNGFVIAIWAGLGLDPSMNFVLYIVWIFGVILNPLGLYFGVGILKGIKIKEN